MQATREALQEQVNSLVGIINGMVGNTWRAPGATLFQSQFQNWSTGVAPKLEELNTLSSRLLAEINSWEEVGSAY